MNNTKTIISYEFINIVKKKSFIITTAITFLFILAVLLIPQIVVHFSADDLTDPFVSEGFEEGDTIETAYVLSSDSDAAHFKDFFETQQHFLRKEDINDLKNAILQGEIKQGIVIDDNLQVTLYIKDQDMMANYHYLLEPLNTWYQDRLLENLDYDSQEVREVLARQLPMATEVIGVDGTKNFAFIYALMIFLYILVIMYGNQVSTSIAREKNDKTMEILITSTSPKHLVNGKIIAHMLAAIVTLMTSILAIFIANTLNSVLFGQESMWVNLSVEPVSAIIYMLFFFTGLLMYLYIYAALGALVSRVEDVSQAVAPIMMIFIFGFFISITGLVGGDSLLFRISTYIPFFSILTMIVRMSMVSVPWWEILIAYGILLATTYVLARLSMKIYRAGTLHYGEKLSLKRVLKQTGLK